MPLFSFRSGYVYALRPLRDRYGPFARGKARRLLVPLLVVGTAFAVLQSLSPGTNGSVADEIPRYQWHIIPIRHLWFLQSIFWVFLAVGLLDRYRKLERVPVVLGLGVACVAADAVVPVGDDLLGFRMALYLFRSSWPGWPRTGSPGGRRPARPGRWCWCPWCRWSR